MKSFSLICLLLTGFLFSCQTDDPNSGSETEAPTEEAVEEMPKEVSFTTTDDMQIFGDLYEQDKSAPSIILFHQGGSNARAEYGLISPRLFSRGFNILAVDQRQGGQVYGSYNRTMAPMANPRFGYCEAYPDLEAALQYLETNGFSGKKIVWGSSYSAALVIQLAAKNPDALAGVLAFSPASGEPMEGCNPEAFFTDLKTPLLLLRPAREMEIESVQKQYQLAEASGHQVYTAENGVHGSSMLVEERTKSNVEPHWAVVLAFLDGLKG